MKKLAIFLILFSLGAMSFAQKKSGTIYYEHELIDKTKAMWSSLIDGDKDAFVNYFADSIRVYQNGNLFERKGESMGGFVTFWSGFENLEITNDHQSNPDAIDYGNMIFVQDWLRISGIHKATGLNNDLSLHNLYGFDENGKIEVIYMYFDPNYFVETKNSQTTKENGTVYINHPYINSVRKLLNEYIAMDIDAWAEYFAPNAKFYFTSLKPGEYMSLEERKESLTELFSDRKEIKFTQVGYPDCIYYLKDDQYTVKSLWKVTDISENGEIYEFSLYLNHVFNKEGKVVMEFAYFNTKK